MGYAAGMDRGRDHRNLPDDGFRALFDLCPDATVLYVSGTVVEANPAAAKMLGAAHPEQLVGKRSVELLHPDCVPNVASRCDALMRGESVPAAEETYIALDGSFVEVEATAARVPHLAGKAFLVILRDVRERREAERIAQATRQTKELERWLRELLDLLPMWICARDRIGSIVLANRTFAEAVGESPASVEGKTLVDLGVPRDVAARLLERDLAVLAQGAPLRTENEPFVATRGGQRWLDTTRFPFSIGDREVVVCACVDATERRRLEAELVHTERLDAIGRLASGVAHDFNNLLTIISAEAEALADVAPAEAREDAHALLEAAGRAGALTRNLLAFAVAPGSDAGTTEVRAALDSVVTRLRRFAGGDVRVDLEVAPDLEACVRMHPDELEHVLVNLAVNARDAMPAGGALRVLAAPDATSSWLCIDVVDTGEGMDDATRARAFEPFFTTKRAGRGTGLGLSACATLVARAGGTIAVDSRPGAGTTVHVRLPVDRGCVVVPSRAGSASTPAVGQVAVLLVDDDPLVRRATARQIARLGYVVHAAGSATDAALLARVHRIDLVVSDVVMPGKSGIELVRELRAEHGNLAALLMSGYSPEHLPVGEGTFFLAKPFSREELAAKLTEALGPRSK